MSPELDKKLCEKYPKIFVHRNKSASESCMAWGFSHGNGWYNIIERLCEAATYTYSTSIIIDGIDGERLGLQKNQFTENYHLDINPPQMVADQCKEKFGTLRVYYHLEFDPILLELNKTDKYPELKEIIDRYQNFFDGMVHMAEIMSGMTCEVSGKKGEMHVSGGSRGGWYRTLNREEAQTNPELKERDFVPVKDLPKDE